MKPKPARTSEIEGSSYDGTESEGSSNRGTRSGSSPAEADAANWSDNPKLRHAVRNSNPTKRSFNVVLLLLRVTIKGWFWKSIKDSGTNFYNSTL